MDTQDNLNHLELGDDCSADKLVFNLEFNAELSDVSNNFFIRGVLQEQILLLCE